MMSLPFVLGRSKKVDKALVVALILAFLFCLNGITSRMMHPDQMVFLPLFHEGKFPFNPGWFEKPPFHTYFSYFLSISPLSLAGPLFDISPATTYFAQVIWSKLLTAFLFLGSIIIVFQVIRKSFGTFAARLVTLIFATSAGFVAHSHFLTADIPVTFWMLVAFYFSQAILFERRATNYILAGLFTGLATATKYNGLAVGITIVVAHLLSFETTAWRQIDWRRLLFDPKLLLGLLMVVIGFLVGNPFSILDYRSFVYDFTYNYLVAPVYEGQTGTSYGNFFIAIVEVIGLPSFLIFLYAAIFSIYSALLNKTQRVLQKTVLLALSVFLLYYIKFAPFPRLETRFILPIVPFWLIISGLFWDKIKSHQNIVTILFVCLISYNLISSYYVGKRFLDDPHMRSEIWAQENMPQFSSVEADIYSSFWNNTPSLQLNEATSPFVTGRERLFQQLFAGNPWIVGSENYMREVDQMVNWYSHEELAARNPDFIVADSRYYQRFVEPGPRRDLYPSMEKYYQDLLNEQYRYEIAYDDQSESVPAWIYPQNIDFLNYRILIFAKKKFTAVGN